MSKKDIKLTAEHVRRLKVGFKIFLWGPLLLSVALAIGGFILMTLEDDLAFIFFLSLVPLAFCGIGFFKITKIFDEMVYGKRKEKAYEEKPRFMGEAEEQRNDYKAEAVKQPMITKESDEDEFGDEEEQEANVESGPFQVNWEEWVGKKLLQKLGIAIVLIGMIFLLQYYRGFFGPISRVLLSVLGGFAFLFAGEWFSKKYSYWAHALTGGGIALLYFSVWAVDKLYAPYFLEMHTFALPTVFALILYGVITFIGILATVRYKAQVIAWLTILGGYLTPLLLGMNNLQHSELVSYLGILAIGILALAFHQKWQYLNITAFLLTQAYLFDGVYFESDPSTTFQIITAIGFFLLFGLLPVVYQFRLQQKATGGDVALVALNGLVIFAAILQVLGKSAVEYTGLVSLLMAAFYIVYSGFALKLCSKDRNLINTYLLSSVILISLALYAELKFEWVMMGWAPFSLLLVFISQKLERKEPFWCGFLLLLGSLLMLVLNIPTLNSSSEMLWLHFTSPWALKSYMVFTVLLSWIFFLKKMPEQLQKEYSSTPLSIVLHTFTVALIFLFFTLEVAAERTVFDFTLDLPFALTYLLFGAVALTVFCFTQVAVWLIAAISGR